MLKPYSFFKSANGHYMSIADFYQRYLVSLSSWYGDKLSIMEDFDIICQCELDFIEILLLGEQEFSLNLLESSREPKDFRKINDFLGWAATRPGAINY